jgi:hypothetical protein
MTMPVRRTIIAAALGLVVWARAPVQGSTPVAQGSTPVTLDTAALSQQLDGLLRDQGNGVIASLWLGGERGGPWFATSAATPRATASAIKTFYLVELFAVYANRLDDPLPGVESVFAGDTHPAVSHFSPAQRDEIRQALRGASVRRIGAVMMGTAPASNVVYNAAANLATAALGGPEALTARIQARDSAFAAVAARRYMLRDRKERGDNEASAEALAALYQRVASRQLPGVDATTIDAIRAAMRRPDDPTLGRHFDKAGNLASDPLAEVRAGWYETAKGPLVYVVMTMQPVPGPDGREASSQRLARTATSLADTLVRAGWASLK